MTTHAHKHLTAWLGILAMWLVVLAPVVSQLITAAQRDNPAESVICSALQPAGHAGLDHHGDRLAACGYCVFLTDHSPAPAVQIALPRLPMHGVHEIVATTSAHVPFSLYSPARPRGPPSAFPKSA
ncbi:DUF2946 domain-containing protein [Paraburkholderia hospita]|uniref:DUF2946 domain-containing protein n=1 Tax=Paraburkholderia hospita TaxID=169430 RepID=UPI000B3484AB|nr:DUF2946 domain-containing protein [Paraburkholderia hospita]OUL70027.1 hypothetical protein CA603_49890 [Paraburkholderia hospita]